MALGLMCPKGHTYVAPDLRAPGDPGGCPVCRAQRQVALLLRAARYAEMSELEGAPDDMWELRSWAERLRSAIDGR